MTDRRCTHGTVHCGRPGRLYPCGIRCDLHVPDGHAYLDRIRQHVTGARP